MKLSFQRSNGELIELGNPNGFTEMNQMIQDKLNQHNYKSHYTRMQMVKETPYTKFDVYKLMIDVGSWSEYFWAEDFNDEELVHLRQVGLINGNI